MNPLDIYNFIKEVFRWDVDRFAAFVTGAGVALFLWWVVRGWMFPRRRDRWLMDRLRQSIERLEKERDTAIRAEVQLRRERDKLKTANARLENDLRRAHEDFKKLRGGYLTLKAARDGLKSRYEQLHSAYRGVEKSLQPVHEELAQARGTGEALKAKVCELEATNRQRQVAIDALSADCESLKGDLSEVDEEKRQSQAQLQERTAEWKQAEEAVHALQIQVNKFEQQIDWVSGSDGRLCWEKEPVAIPNVRSPGTAGARIVSVLNLKGGVGKTTLAANLGATLWNQKKRVLLIDLDYQASLSMLCLPPEEFSQVRRGRRFVQQLLGSQALGAASLNNLLTPLGGRGDLGFLLAADEDLLDVEMQAQVRWLVNPDEGDIRYRLRHVLHDPEVRNGFDFILLDCPPRLTTACVNALACSDYALIPVLLDQTSADAIPRLLQWLRRLQPTLCPELSILGVVANRVSLRNGALTKGQQDVWNELPQRCKDVWREPIDFFKTLIKQDSAFAEAANNHSFAAFDPVVKPSFLDLAKEISRRIETHERSRAAAVPPKSQQTPQHVGSK